MARRRTICFPSIAFCLALSASCTSVRADFTCDQVGDCVDGASQGTCEPSGFCSFPDATCPAPGRRFADRSGPSSNQCVGAGAGEDGGACGLEFCGDGVDGDCSGGADPACPSNDRMTSPIDVSAGGEYSATLSFAHDDVQPSCALAGGRDIFYEFTLATEEVISLRTLASSFSVALAVFSGPCASMGQELACAAGNCFFSLSHIARSFAAGTYCVVVDHYEEWEDSRLELQVVRGGRAGIELGATQMGSTCAASNLAEPSCGAPGGADVAYFWPTCGIESATVTTCAGTDFDTVLHARFDSASSSDAACSDDSCGMQSSLTFETDGAVLAWIIVDSAGACGSYTLTRTE